MPRDRRYRWTLWLPAGALALCGVIAFVIYTVLLAGLPDPARSPGLMGTPSILIVDRYGRTLYEVIDSQGNKYQPLPLADIPPACQQATIATEDSRFFSHPGLDPIAIVRATWLNFTGGRTVSGGSTLTQQLARNLYLSPDERNERSLRRKLREAWLAWGLERKHSKNDLLALYLNTTYYGHFATGIEAAAQAYFGVHARELDLAQCALLAGLPQYPSGYNPLENPAAAQRRQGVVLDLMVRSGYIDAAQAADAGRERLAFASTPFPIEAPHFTMWVQGQLEGLLTAEQLRLLNQTLAQRSGESRTLRVETTLDLDWQRQAEAIVRRRLGELRPCAAGRDAAESGACDAAASPERRVDDAALVALDPASGAVLAMVGSADYFNPAISGAVNAALSPRQPGSAIKPLTYAAAFDPDRARRAGQQPWTPATLIADVRTVFPTDEGRPYVPNNYDMAYHGPVTARMALANSYNIPAVKALQFVGVPALIELANRLGIDWSLGFTPPAAGGLEVPADNAETPGKSLGLALTLGGGEVRLLDLTAAYGALANGGRRVTPNAISRVVTSDGQIVVEYRDGAWIYGDISSVTATPPPSAGPAQVLDPRVAYLVTDILSDNTARTPAFGQGNALEIGRPAAAKTGTTTDWRDNWTLGYTPDLVTGVWVGNADNAPMMDISGITGAGPIWHDFMTAVLRGVPARSFDRPDGLEQVEVCADSGLLPGSESADASATSTGAVFQPPAVVPCPARRPEWFINGTQPANVDQMHQRIAIDVRTGAAASAQTPREAVYTETFWILPDEYQDWARSNDVPQPFGWTAQAAELRSGSTAAAGAVAARPAGGVNAGDSSLARSSPARPAAPALVLLSPESNRSYRIDAGLPPEMQQVPVVARPGPSFAGQDPAIRLLVDGNLLATVPGPDYTAWWTLVAGRHTFQAIAQTRDGAEIRSEPVAVTVAR